MYDPSYGAGPFDTANDHENAAIAGFDKVILGTWHAKTNTPAQELDYNHFPFSE